MQRGQNPSGLPRIPVGFAGCGSSQGLQFWVELDKQSLENLDRRGYTVLEAVTYAGSPALPSGAPPPGTLATPHKFVCIDGKTYWIKIASQQGLVAELIAGRLAAEVGAGPPAKVVRLTTEALPPGRVADHLVGVGVGLEDIQGAVNSKDLPLLTDQDFDPAKIDGRSRARLVAFHSWIGVDDTQALLDLRNGTLWSIDHGGAFSSTATATDPSLLVLSIHRIPDSVGKTSDDTEEAVDRIESVTDKRLLELVSQVPGGTNWRSPTARRFEIAEWLAYRRDRLRGVVKSWLKS